MHCASVESRRRVLRAGAVAAAALGAPWVAAAAPDPAELVRQADRVRNPAVPFGARLRLSEFRSGKLHDSATLMLLSKLHADSGRWRNLAWYLEPAADAGKALLMDEQILWFHDPGSSSSVRISPQQRLVGQASNGDVITVALAQDYRPRLVGEAGVEDADGKQRTAWQLELEAANSQAVYRRIELWLDTDGARPIKARFYADSGRALKLAFYRRYSRQLGEMRPGETIILDEVDTSVATRMAVADYKAMELPERWFSRDYLPRLGDEVKALLR